MLDTNSIKNADTFSSEYYKNHLLPACLLSWYITYVINCVMLAIYTISILVIDCFMSFQYIGFANTID